MSRWVTGVALGVLGVLAALIFWPAHGLDTLDRPEQSLERVVGSDMDFRAAARTAPGWERRLHRLAFASDASARADALAWYDELVREEGSPLAELYRIVLLAEDGQTEALEAAVTAWAPGDDEARRLATWARAAYEAEPPPPEELRTALAAVRRELPSGWFADRLAARLASRLGDAAAAAEAERATVARGTRLLWRFRAILAVEALLVALGLVVLVAWLAGPGARGVRVATAPIPPRWTPADGVGLFARGAVGLVGVALVWPFLPDTGWATLLMSVLQTIPLGGYLLWSCRFSWRTLVETFGLRVPRASVPALVRATLGARGRVDPRRRADRARGHARRRRDALDRRLPGAARVGHAGRGGRGRPGQLRLRAAPGGAAVPRGALRDAQARPRAAPATIASAALFALAHGYGAVGFASVFVSGVLWAIAYERTRSLLPGMLAHAASNIQATAIVLATLRF